MISHNFIKSLSYERSKFKEQDKFYQEQLGATDIKRIDYDTEKGKELQEQDIDVILTVDGKAIAVSEKNRKGDYGDLLMKFYSKFPNIPGWMETSQADYIAYFVPGKVYWINNNELKSFYKDTLKNVVENDWFDNLKKQNPYNSTRETKTVNLNGEKEEITLTHAYNKTKGACWYTESVCVKYDCLKKHNVTITTYPLL